MKTTRTLAIAGFALALMLAVSAGPRPAFASSTTFTLSASPTTVAPGGTVSISGSITSGLSKNARLTINYDVTGPCGYTDHASFTRLFKPGETYSATALYTAPACPGTYPVTGTVFDGSTLLASASTSFTVQ